MYKGVGMEIAKKCKGLPLAAKTLGSLLSCKNGLVEWENVLRSEIWELKEAEVQLFPHLLLSYNELTPALKHCFSYCAVFPKDSRIEVEEVIGHWMALGYLGSDIGSGGGGGDMELRGRQYFHNLAMRSLFQDFEKDEAGEQIKYFQLHDIVHDFARFLRNNGTVVMEVGTNTKTSCQAYCSPELVSQAKEYRSLYWDGESPICMTCLRSLRVLRLRISGIPQKIDKFIHLRWLDFSFKGDLYIQDLETICNELYNLQTLLLQSCKLEEIPRGIGNLIHLRHLDLSHNGDLKELPESICDLRELQTLDITFCHGITSLPQGIHRLVNLKHLHNEFTKSLGQFPQGLAQLTYLRTLTEFQVGENKGKLGWLKSLNRLSGSLKLIVSLIAGSENMVEDVREGELRNKEYLQELEISFKDCWWMDEVEDCVWMNVIDALQPHPNLQKLTIFHFKGSRLPAWIASPLNQVKSIRLFRFSHLSSLPPLGKLPCLEEIVIDEMQELQFVGREFLGLATETETGRVSSSSVVYFPKLKNLKFSECSNWEEWEDITAQEEEEALSLMPHLTELRISRCNSLAALPHRLLRKASSLKELEIFYSAQLQQLYEDKQGSPWRSISDINPSVKVTMFS
ncbi:putative disease resistance protein rga4 [Phtheirospermum japonicum]|uniref:Putative disease resistance protein rga4 n=1 Tax=Phtheirospermum japonicum TaxID=374723 RepID=A0A830BNK2_9LAMI|nr:putative disease resistance protein rga4 [Phtheirospermum japonicum]